MTPKAEVSGTKGNKPGNPDIHSVSPSPTGGHRLRLSGNQTAANGKGKTRNVSVRGEAEVDEKIFANDNIPLAIAYVPMQRWQLLYEENIALDRGTIFRDLDKPFIGEEAVK